MKITPEKHNNCCWAKAERFIKKHKILIGIIIISVLILWGARVQFIILNDLADLRALKNSPLLGNALRISKGAIQISNVPTSLSTFELAYDIIECESNWNPKAIGDNGKAYGLAQFHKPTWDWLCELSGKDLDYYNPNHQIKLLVWALENNRGYLWTCYNKVI